MDYFICGITFVRLHMYCVFLWFILPIILLVLLQLRLARNFLKLGKVPRKWYFDNFYFCKYLYIIYYLLLILLL